MSYRTDDEYNERAGNDADPWNSGPYKDDPTKPWNDPMYRDDPRCAWESNSGDRMGY